MPTTSIGGSRRRALLTTARMTALRPGQSPPAVRMPMRFTCDIHPSNLWKECDDARRPREECQDHQSEVQFGESLAARFLIESSQAKGGDQRINKQKKTNDQHDRRPRFGQVIVAVHHQVKERAEEAGVQRDLDPNRPDFRRAEVPRKPVSPRLLASFPITCYGWEMLFKLCAVHRRNPPLGTFGAGGRFATVKEKHKT